MRQNSNSLFWILAPKIKDFLLILAPKIKDWIRSQKILVQKSTNFRAKIQILEISKQVFNLGAKIQIRCFEFPDKNWIFWHSLFLHLEIFEAKIGRKTCTTPIVRSVMDRPVSNYWGKCNHNKHLFPIFPPFDSNLSYRCPSARLGNPMVFWFSRLQGSNFALRMKLEWVIISRVIGNSLGRLSRARNLKA